MIKGTNLTNQCTRLDMFSLPSFYHIFPLLFVIMEPLIIAYYYYDEGHNVLETVEVFPHVDLIIIRKKK